MSPRLLLFLSFLGISQLHHLSIEAKSPRARQPWVNHGRDLFNSRHAMDETKISTSSVSKLKLKWKFQTGFDVTATPAVADGVVYFPSWNGNLYALNAASGAVIWTKNLTVLTGIQLGDNQRGANATLSRTTPTVAGDRLIVGLYGPAVVIAVSRANGNLIWSKTLDSSPGGVITMSGTSYNGAFYIGTSSIEENFPALCCTFQGSFLKLDLATGNILWRTRMLPDNHGSQGLYSGAPIWGSSPSIDVKRNHVYIATGNLYSAPPDIQACQAAQNNKSKPDVPDPCIKPGNHLESMLALDLGTGAIKWSHQLGGYDAWVASCTQKPVSPNCPTGPNPDYDFSDCPTMLTIKYRGKTSTYLRDIVVAAQKSGVLWALDRDDGTLVWTAVAGPGGGGGQVWGQAVDSERIYVNVPNSRAKNWTLAPSTTVITTGGWCAVNASTGAILWSIPNPTKKPPIGPLSVANGVVLATSMDLSGTVFALEGRTGSILWRSKTDATIFGGASISAGCAYVGSGASVNVGRAYGGTVGKYVYAFCHK